MVGEEKAMNNRILVTYATKYSATKEIAERIGEVLRQTDLQVDVLPVKGIDDVTPYGAVVLGCAVYIGKWPKEAGEFLKAHEKILAERPLWLFSSGPTGDGRPVDLLEGWQVPAEQQSVIDRIQPRNITVFHGNINPDKVNFIEKWAVKSLVKKPFGDFRDWDAIASWAASIADALQNAERLAVPTH
jgi:menaquinone-dependent protoporphyrinogen oxidase